MQSIDNVFDEMDDAERNFKLSKKRDSTKKNVQGANMKRNQGVPSHKKRELSYNSTNNRTNVDFDNLINDLNKEKYDW